MTLSVKEIEAKLSSFPHTFETRDLLKDDEGRYLRGDDGYIKWSLKYKKTVDTDSIEEWMDIDDEQIIEGLGLVKRVEEHGGEGEGDSAHFVLRVIPDDGSQVRFFKMYGSYQSYDGFYWDGPFVEVKPVDRTVTFYEEVK